MNVADAVVQEIIIKLFIRAMVRRGDDEQREEKSEE
jgi:hypothetical protein